MPVRKDQILKLIYCATVSLHDDTQTRPWKELKLITDRVHRNDCGHSSYTDMKTLMERNGIWTKDVQHYLVQVMESCPSCKCAALPRPTRKVSLSSLTKESNEVVCVDHMYLGKNCVMHLTDSKTRCWCNRRVCEYGKRDRRL